MMIILRVVHVYEYSITRWKAMEGKGPIRALATLVEYILGLTSWENNKRICRSRTPIKVPWTNQYVMDRVTFWLGTIISSYVPLKDRKIERQKDREIERQKDRKKILIESELLSNNVHSSQMIPFTLKSLNRHFSAKSGKLKSVKITLINSITRTFLRFPSQ